MVKQTNGFAAERLAKINGVMTKKYVETGLLPGILTQVWRRGETVYTGMSGQMDIERAKPMREDAIFRIYSMTKPITAVALMMLVEEGRLSLDDDVHKYIPSWKNLRVYASGVPSLAENTAGQFLTVTPKRRMKIVDIVTHTSGLTYGFMMRTSVDAEYRRQKIGDHQTPGGLDAFIAQLAELPLDFSPGDHWNYSVAIDVMGYLVQKLSGQTFGEFLRTRIFEPLGMKDTAFSVPANKMERFASCYIPKSGGGLKLQDDAGKSTYAEPPKLESGRRRARFHVARLHALLPHDAGRWHTGRCAASLAKNSRDVLDEPAAGWKAACRSCARRRLVQRSRIQGVGFSIGCGVTLDPAKTLVPGTPGEFFWGGAASTAFWIDPKEDLAVVFMTQVIGENVRLATRRDLRTLVYSAMTESFA